MNDGIQLETLSDVVKLLRSPEHRDGVHADTFRANGLYSLEGVAVGLRARGYEVEVFANRLKLLAPPRCRGTTAQTGPRNPLRPSQALLRGRGVNSTHKRRPPVSLGTEQVRN